MDRHFTRTLVLVENEQSRTSLCDSLRRFGADVVEDANRIDPSYDICFMDGAALAHLDKQILQMKQSAEPVCIPCILVEPKEHAAKVFHQYPACIDQILDTPFSDAELRIHLDMAVRARRRSVSLNETFSQATTQAKLSEERYRIVSELTSDYAYGFVPASDGTYALEWVTHAFEQKIGYTLEELKRQGWGALIHPDDMPAILERRQRLNVGLMDVREFRVITRSGKTRWVLDHVMPIIVDGKVSRVYGAARDITEQKATITALQVSEHKNAEIARLVPVMIYQTDAEGNVTYVNERWSHFTGLPSERAYGLGWKDALHPDDLSRFDNWQRFVKQGETFTAELRYLKPDGSIVWAYTWAEPQWTEDGTPAGYIGTVADISESKAAEEALRQSEYRLRRVLDALPIGVWIFNSAGDIVQGNQAGREIWGGARYAGFGQFADYKGRWLDSGKQIEPEEWAAARAIRKGETSMNEELEIECFDGTRKIILNSAVPLYDDQRDLIGAIAINQDIGERKRAEDKLRTHAEILSNMAEGVIVTDETGLIFYANTAMERIYGYAAGELLGMQAWQLKAAPEEEARALTVHIVTILQTQGRWSGEFESRRKNGEVFTMAARIRRIEIAGKPYIVSVDQDVTELKKAEEIRLRLAAIVQSSDDAIMAQSLNGTITSWNPAAEAMFGYTSDEICGKPVSTLMLSDNKDDYAEIIAHLSRGQGLKNVETTRMRKDGSVIDVSLTLSPIKDATGRVIGAAKIARDITEKKKAEENLRLWERAMAATSNGVVIVDVEQPDFPAVYANAAFERITGYSIDEVLGRNPEFLLGTDTDQPVWQEIEAALRERREKRVVLRNYRKDGRLFWNELSLAPVINSTGRVTHFVAVQNDITERKRYEAELEYQATHDSLTSLPNRSLLEDRLQQAIAHAHRDKKMAAVLYIDLDRFKVVNDSVGHEAGDQLLRQMSQRLQEIFRAGDTVARRAGDEFVVVLERIAGEQEANYFAQRLMQALAAPFLVAEREFYVSCSIGIGLYPKDGTTASELLKNAEAAMYRAKELGRSNFQFYTPTMNERARERLEIEGALRHALEREEFLLHYQPQVDLGTGAVVGMEALIRWQHPTLGLLPPSRFIGLAEETGLIVPIGAWVLRTACAQAKTWQNAGFGDLRIAVNLSARQFAQQDLVHLISTTLEETGLAARFLDIELTESLVMTDVERAVCILNDLRALGVQLSIDDFGTGYSSLSYLKLFPIDVLKIDRSFVNEISTHANDAAISDAIISMAHSLGISVIAEGVETEAQCEFLSRNMCDEMQGLLFSGALPPKEIETLLSEARCLPQRLLRMHKPPRTLLLVDDEPNILSALKRLIRRANYKILTAASGKEGLELLAQNDIDVIVSDQRMPGMTGVEFLRTVKNLYPDTVRIVLSGFTELQSVTDAVNEGAIYKFLTKPWDDAQLREHIEEAFQHKEMVDENRRLNLEVRSANREMAKANRQLEEVLKQKQQQIKRDEVTIDIVHEALQHVPLPVIGLDDDQMVVFINVAAQALFKNIGSILGYEAAQFMPEVVHALHGVEEGQVCIAKLNGTRYEVISRSMGKGTQSRGKLITLTRSEEA
jgi:diguanylate cyclase (GGDEF)-like protein/PAS domain S-box-containing protein